MPTKLSQIDSLRVKRERNAIVCERQQKRIRELEQDILNEREARSQAVARTEQLHRHLEVARKTRQTVQQECESPYLVPALLEALMGSPV